MSGPKVLYVFNRARAERQEMYLGGRCPDDALYAFNALKKRGFDTRFSDKGHTVEGFAKAYKLLDDLMSQRGRRTGFHLWQARRLIDEIRDADLVYATADSSGLPVCLLKKLGVIDTPVVYQSIGLAQAFRDGGLRFRFYRRLLHHADEIVCFSKAEKLQLTRRFRIPENKVHFIAFGVDRDFYRIESSRQSGPVALGMDRSRDWNTLAESLAGSGLHVRVYTNPDHLRHLALPEEFQKREPVSFEELAKLIANASFAVLPVRQNSYTGATISLLSCMAAGKAVIVSRTSAIDEGYGLVDGKNCVLVSPEDTKALRRAMTKLSGDAELCGHIGRCAAAHIQKGFTAGRMADDLAAIFRKVLL